MPGSSRSAAPALYRAYRDGVRDYYRRHYPLTDSGPQPFSSSTPATATVSRICHEPRVSLAVLEAMLAPHVTSGRLTVLLRHVPVGGRRRRRPGPGGHGPQSLDGGSERVVHAEYFLDATELGDLLPLTGTEYVTGFESRRRPASSTLPSEAQPANMQAFTVCFADRLRRRAKTTPSTSPPSTASGGTTCRRSRRRGPASSSPGINRIRERSSRER